MKKFQVIKCLYSPFILLGLIFVLSLTSCKDGEEVYTWNGCKATIIHVSVIDYNGKDLVEEWVNTSNENKSVESEITTISRYPHVSSESLFTYHYKPIERVVFMYRNLQEGIIFGDKILYRFKMYETDKEEILLEGCCTRIKPYDFHGIQINEDIVWSFRGITLPMERSNFSTVITLIRTEDGRYTLKQ